MSKIVQASNHNLDWYNESFILWSMPYDVCKEIADIINKHEGMNSAHYYKVVDNDYKLYIGMVP